MNDTPPVHRRVKTATIGAATAGLILWGLETYLFKGTVPDPVAFFIYTTVPGAVAFGFGYKPKVREKSDS